MPSGTLCAATFLTIPPYTHSESFTSHATFDLVRRLGNCILGLSWASWCLIMPFLIGDLETHYFVDIVEQPDVIKVPDPQLFAVAATTAVSRCRARAGKAYYSAPCGSSSNGTKMSPKKSVLRWMPEGVELRILASITSPLNGRKTTMRNSTEACQS